MPSNLFCFLFLLLLPLCVFAQTNHNVSIGSSLTAGDNASAPWLSESGGFTFGFRQVEGKDLFLLAVWYQKIPDTIVWYANGDNPAARGSKVELTTDQGLALTNPQGEDLWRSPFTRGSVAYGIMNDTGNFVLIGETSESLWESFKDPTDTLLPTQIMELDGVLSSRKGTTDFSRGRFQFRLLEDGNAVLNPINIPSNNTYDAYYVSGTRDTSNQSNSGYRVIFDNSGFLYIERRSGERFYITKPDEVVSSTSYYHRATLNFDGVFTVGYHPKNSPSNDSWTVIRSIPDNICVDLLSDIGSGPCGFNSICKLDDNQRPTCSCPQGYSLLENDPYESCKPDFTLSCEEDAGSAPENIYDLVQLPNTDWPFSDYEFFRPYNIEDCKNSCMHDCLCAATIFKDNSCWKKRLPLSNGREDREERSKAFIKVRKNNFNRQDPPNPVPADANNKGTLTIVVSVLLGSSVFVNVLLVGAMCLGFFFFYRRKLTLPASPDESVMERNLRQFTYEELTLATDGFKEELGRGSCGIVYRGIIETSPIAVKKLDRVLEDSDKEFKTEVNVIGKTHHKNLVSLLGYCAEGQHRMLVYEFLSNGTLASFLFGDLKPSWSQRTHIAFHVARGLFYLHEECSTQIIHCDIKPQNILLDEYHNARISDFGLAKLLLINQSQTKTHIRGTKGYVAPDWFRTSPVTVKVDVYSFGVLLLEIICCRRNVDIEAAGEERGILTDWAYDCYQLGKLDALVGNDAEAISDTRKLERFVMVAIWCLQEEPSLRPTMKKVMLMLEGIVQVSVPPSPCPFSSIS
ncbi:G-type lectin S-receptor-like serine/threonine-protein kinase LECRK3 [Malania oleifera]|uniref:G-type lectin S-receptor-like serine/threonine-protein kinase LECRK3 n=1 Tax=Malania oleifera TaxID=397392 RepID=UPI0025AE3681|nr:G-type lectin S-receptor-like serine/threonine-protein kinase LECRK3 [Malania oleifera]